ncbi:MAG: type II secretion system protein [Candidatus Pacebacteria bacterium]|nr:type II secretion system protein [Candidatus Paceibacterota bacterium]
MEHLFKKTKSTNGFTLIEMMVAVSIFAIIMTISMGALLNIISLNKKSQAVKTIMNNLNFALEEMSRDLRFGAGYDCVKRGVGYSSSGSNCSSFSVNSPPTYVSFKFHGIRDLPGVTRTISYYLVPLAQPLNGDNNCSQIWKYSFDGTNVSDNPITAPEVCIQDNYTHSASSGLKLYVISPGTGISDNTQARVLILVSGYTGTGKTQTVFNLQTTVTERQLNI